VLISAKSLTGIKIKAEDGVFGKIADIFFDDRIWNVQYVVANTGSWLPGRKALLPRAVLKQFDESGNAFEVGLTKQEIQNSPPIAADEPVSRQYETSLLNYFKLLPYWGPEVPAASYEPDVSDGHSGPPSGDPALRSCREVFGYGIDAADGDIGQMSDFIVDDRTWVLRYAVVDTRKWLPGRTVLVAIPWIDSVSWSHSTVQIDLTRDQIKDSPEFDPREPVNRQYEDVLYDYYGRPRYWGEPGHK
jgi:hypothetical protein